MKTLIFFLLLSFQVSAKPLEVMNQKLADYKQSNAELCLSNQNDSLDNGLFVDISCSFTCKGSGPKVERVKGSFIPKELGLYPGNGSSAQNIIWSSVGIMLKVWSQKVCLNKAANGCHGIKLVTMSAVSELESGKWSIKSFPGCNDRSITLSPFDESSGSNRMNQTSRNLLSHLTTVSNQIEVKANNYQMQLKGLFVEIPYGKLIDKQPCKNKIKADLCFGDCINLKSDKYEETLGTSEPLGREKIEICGDDLVAKLGGPNLSLVIKKQICEDYFWNTLKTTGQNLISSCAAVRGGVICEGL